MNEKKIPPLSPVHRKAVQHYMQTEPASQAVRTLCQEILYLRARLSQTKRWLRVANKTTAATSLAMENTVGKLIDANQHNREWAQSYSELQRKCDLLEDELQTLKARYHA